MANPIILFQRQDGSIAAVSSTCSHSGCEVKKRRTQFECPCHGSEYDLDGTVTRGPASEPLDVFDVKRYSDRWELTL
jgi:cytochrome b6-f complex iron-sulfur subunit